MPDPSLSRRTVLGVGTAGILGAGVLGVAGCRAAPSNGSSAASGSGSGSESGAAHSSGAAAGTPVALAKLSDVPVGGSAAAKTQVDGHPVVLSQQTAGKVAAFSAICTHMGCTVNAGGPQFHCPCHGSVYDAFTGQVVRGPAPQPLTSIPVTVTGGEIVTS